VKGTYDAETDTLRIVFNTTTQVAESDECRPGVILDYDQDGNLVSLEVLDASEKVTDARHFDFEARS